MVERDYLILSGDTLVAKWDCGLLSVYCDELLPLYLKRVKDADLWLETRAIDSHRANSRLLKKALKLKEKDDISTAYYVHGATITDNYWVKPLDSALTYEDIRFKSDAFSLLALKGTYASFDKAANSIYTNTPELTNTGSFEKCWRLVNGNWWIYKSATHHELFSELFIYRFGKALGMNMAVYEQDKRCIRTLDFTNNASFNFEPAFTFMADNEDYEDVLKALTTLCPQAIDDYVRMIILDTIVANPDRHTANFGLLRSIKTGKLIGLAPVFDHNMALISHGYLPTPSKYDLLINSFNEFIANHPEFKRLIPNFDEDMIIRIVNDIGLRVKAREVATNIIKRYNMIKF